MKKNTTLEYAKYYISKGFSVIPLKPRDKKPAVESWKEYQSRRPTDEELEEWFVNDSKNNIGIVTGSISGIAVVDFDTVEAVEILIKDAPLTPIVITGKGCHAYYKNIEGLRNFQNRDDLQRVDLRCEGGYVVAPPSIHPLGKQYEWVKEFGLDDLPLAELPEIFLSKTKENMSPLKELYGGVTEGRRNNSLARLTGSWVNDELAFEECLENARIWNSKNTPPLSEEEVERTVRSIFEKHHINSSQSSHRGNVRVVGQESSSEADVDPYTFLIRGSDLVQLDLSVEWVIDKLIPKQSITLLHGKGGVGKTWLSLNIGEAVSTGRSFMGLETQRVPVVFIDFENPLPVLRERIIKTGAVEILIWHNTNEQKRPPKLDGQDWELYKKLPLGSLIMIDTLRASQSKDENDSREMALIMGRLKELRDIGFTIIILHHTPKSNDKTYKGSTAIMDLADHVLSLHKVKRGSLKDTDDEDEEGYYRFGTKEKTRYEPFHIFLDFDPEQGFVIIPDPDDESMKAIQSLIIKLKESKGEYPIQSQIIERVGKELELGDSKIRKLLRKGEGKYWRSTQIKERKNALEYEAL